MKTAMYQQYRNISPEAAHQAYGATLMEAYGIKDPAKLSWMSRLAAIKQHADGPLNESEQKLAQLCGINLNESYGPSNTPGVPGGMPGMGATAWPSDPGTGVGASQNAWFNPLYKSGSGDIPSQIMGLSLNIAAYTTGFDLAPVIPVDMPSGMLQFLDAVYGGGDLGQQAAPQYLELIDTNINASFNWAGFTYGQYVFIGEAATADGKAIRGKYIGKSQFTGTLLFKVEGTGDIASKVFTPKTSPAPWTINEVIADLSTGGSITPGSTATAADGTAIALAEPRVALVSAVREHIAGASNRDGITKTPMTREQTEQGTSNKIQLKMWSKSFEIKGYDIEADTSRIQMRDLKAYGIDGLAMLYKAAQNQLTQSISENIVDNIAALGVQNHAQMNVSQGLNLHLFVGPGGTANKALTAFNSSAKFVDPLGNNRSAGFGNIVNSETNSSAENLHTRQRKLYSRILAASNIVGNTSRVNVGDIAVTNTQIGTALQDCAGFVAAPSVNTIGTTADLNFIGTVGAVRVYVNPRWSWDDLRVVVGRKGGEDDAGLKVLVYDLASSVEIINPNTYAQSLSILSRYELIPAGFFPEASYLTFLVASDFGQFV